MRNKILFFLFFVPLFIIAQSKNLSLIPLPQEVNQGDGQFVLPKILTYCVDSYSGDSISAIFQRFRDEQLGPKGIKTKVAKPGKAVFRMQIDKTLGDEAYTLNIDGKKVVVTASRPVGFFYALQTFQQLLTSSNRWMHKDSKEFKPQNLPLVNIKDEPRFGWRGFMLDEGRHFFGKETVKLVLDVMARYKMNRFHWHLTEDQGWRIEIKKYPKLTEVGAWRNSKVLGWGDVKPDGQRYGGFYSQDDIKEIVAYAAERFIEIVPEIDIPGHSQAAIASYPELLACDGGVSKHEVWLLQGVSKDVMCVSNPMVVQFAKDVIDELTDLFPFNYLHLGGDECPTEQWQKTESCKQQMSALGTTNYRDLQIFFYKQLQDHIAQQPLEKQRKLIFWNEVLHGNTALLNSDITIMAWVGADKAALSAAKAGLNTILSPQIPYYINRKQSTLSTEPHSQGRGTETLEAVYNYIPMNGVQNELQSHYMGVQANFWSEWVEDASTLEYLMLPRLAAVAEAGWTRQSLRSYANFVERMQTEADFYQNKGLNYGKHVFK